MFICTIFFIEKQIIARRRPIHYCLYIVFAFYMRKFGRLNPMLENYKTTLVMCIFGNLNISHYTCSCIVIKHLVIFAFMQTVKSKFFMA